MARPMFVPNSCLLTEDRAGPLLMLQGVADIPRRVLTASGGKKKNHSKLEKQIQEPDVRKTRT